MLDGRKYETFLKFLNHKTLHLIPAETAVESNRHLYLAFVLISSSETLTDSLAICLRDASTRF